MIRPLVFQREKIIKLLVYIFLTSMILKISLASLLWAPRAFKFEDLLDNIYNVNENIFISQFLTVLIFCSGALNLFFILSKFKISEVSIKRYVYLYFMFYFLTLISALRSDVTINLEMIAVMFTPMILFSLLYYNIDIVGLFILTFTVILFVSLVSALVNPDWAYVLDYESDLAIFDKRFAGILSHPNVTGVVSIICIVFALARKNSYVLFSLFVALCSLIMSQSKTNWLACFFIITLYLTRGFLTKNFLIGIFLLIGIPFTLFPFIYLPLAQFLPDNQIFTLTGRVAIWEEALNYFNNYPFFGFGGNAWGVSFRELTELTGANHAHNQLLETMSTQGIFGLLILLSLFGILFKNFGENLSSEEGFIFSAFFFYIILRGVSEPSVSHNNVTIVLFVMLIVSYYGLLLQRNYNEK